MKPSVAPVLVAGGGPSGLVIALTLLQNNVPVRVIDKEPHHRISQRSNGVWPRTFEVFHLLRVHEMYQSATPILPMQEYKPGTLEPARTFPVVTHDDPTPSIPYINPMFLGQPKIEAILRSHLEKHGCFVELSTELHSFEQNEDRVLAKIIKRKDGEEVSETFEAAYLIGADGAKGITRKQLGLTFLGETRQDFASVVGDICFEMEGIDRNHWHSFGSSSSDLLLLRPTDDVGPDGFQFLMTLKSYEPSELVADEKLMSKCMSELIGHKINIREIVALSHFRPNIRMVDTFGHGRVFVAGDAAHVHSPTGGQGLNSGVQDALNLGWKLALVHRGFSPDTLLDSYTTERLPVIAEMLNITTGLLDKIRSSQTFQSALGRHNARLKMLGVNYRTSPIVVDAFTHAEPVSAYGDLDERVLVAGDRAPDAPGLVLVASGTETRLFDVFRPTCHTVLVFIPDGSSVASILEVLREYPGEIIRSMIILPRGGEGTTVAGVDAVVDRDGHACRAYLVADGDRKVVVVRPDGVVGAIVRGGEGVRAYFSKVFVAD